MGKSAPATVLIVALSARALAQSAARAGFEVSTVDLFADCDTRAVSVFSDIARPRRGGFDVASLREAVDAALGHCKPDLVVCGSGFENQPALIDELFPKGIVAGNPARTIASVCDPGKLFPTLLALRIPFPETITSGRVPADGWLRKQIGASGGAHVMDARSGQDIAPGYYAQRKVTGQSMSAVFLSDAHRSELLGCCRHWQAQPRLLSAYQQSGIVRTRPSAALERTLIDWGRRISTAIDLRGLWGVDFMCERELNPMLVDINPRPPASFELLEAGGASLFGAHVAACNGNLQRPAVHASSRAAAIYYAVAPLTVMAGFHWPEWTADRPAEGATITPIQPVCTIFGEAMTGEDAVGCVAQRLRELEHLFVSHAVKVI